VLEACGGAGKSTLAAIFAKAAKEYLGRSKTVIVLVAPSREIQRGLIATLAEVMGISKNSFASEISYTLGGNYLEAPETYEGFVMSYQGMQRKPSSKKGNPLEVIQRWKDDGWKFVFIFDEIHHASERNSWGGQAQQYVDAAEFSLVMTGTPFRSDEFGIVGIRYEYNKDAKTRTAIPDYIYSYKEGVRDGVVRPLVVVKRDVTEFKVQISETGETREYKTIRDVPSQDKSKVINQQLLKPGQDLCNDLIDEAWRQHALKKTNHPNAGLLFVVPGETDSEKNIENYRKDIETMGKAHGFFDVVAITSKMKDAPQIIDEFRGSKHVAPKNDAMVAIKMVSEGTDIPRIMTICFLTTIGSPMLFSQIAWRATRITGKNEVGTLVIPNVEQMVEWGKNMEMDALQALREPCPKCEERPCVCPCRKCGESPCECDRTVCRECLEYPCVCKKDNRSVFVYDEKAEGVGGNISTTSYDIKQSFINIADNNIQLLGNPAGLEPVRTGAVIQKMFETNPQIEMPHVVLKEEIGRQKTKMLIKLRRRLYDIDHDTSMSSRKNKKAEKDMLQDLGYSIFKDLDEIASDLSVEEVGAMLNWSDFRLKKLNNVTIL